jgi:hypothetical protein
MAYRRAAHCSGRLPITSPATALFHFNPSLRVPRQRTRVERAANLISCVAAEASSAVPKDRVSAGRRYLAGCLLPRSPECRTARDASPRSPLQARGQGYTRSIGTIGASIERRRELVGRCSAGTVDRKRELQVPLAFPIFHQTGEAWLNRSKTMALSATFELPP